MIRSLPVLLCLFAACAAFPGGAGGETTLLAVQPSGAELGSEITSLVLGTSERSGRRVVSLDLRNETDETIHFAWSVEWMDKTGAICPGTPGEWRSTHLEAGAEMPIEIEAPSPHAASWRLLAVAMDR
jgi:uncharacterized protein YcfL